MQQLASLKQHCRTNRHGTRREAKKRKREEEEARETLESTDPEVEIETHPIISEEDIKTEMPEPEDTGESKEGEEPPSSDSEAEEPCSPLKSNKDREREQEKRRKERWMEWKEGIKVLPMGDGEEEGEDGTSGQRQKCS